MAVFGLLVLLYMQPQQTVEAAAQRPVHLLADIFRSCWYLFTLTLFLLTLTTFRLSPRGSLFGEAVLAAIFYALFHIGWRHGGILSDLLLLEHAATYYPFFILGYWSRKYDVVAWLLRHNYIFALSLVLYVALFSTDIRSLPVPHIVSSALGYGLTPVSAIIVCVYVAASRETETSKIENHLACIGRYTLGIYVLHPFVVMNTDLTSLAPFFASDSNQLVMFLLLFALGYAIVWVCIAAEKLMSVSLWMKKWLFAGR